MSLLHPVDRVKQGDVDYFAFAYARRYPKLLQGSRLQGLPVLYAYVNRLALRRALRWLDIALPHLNSLCIDMSFSRHQCDSSCKVAVVTDADLA